LTLLRSVKRPGVDALVDYITNSNFFTVNCYGHHFVGEGGVAQHSLEVYRFMHQLNGGRFSEESVILCALTHDLGKCDRAKRDFRTVHGHDRRSLKVLQHCGVPLSDEERLAVLNHRRVDSRIAEAKAHPLYGLLGAGDCTSTGTWKALHLKDIAARKAAKAARKAARR
jgi:hypothetical protein